MHRWGDKDADWKGIDQAAKFIHDYCVKWGRLGGSYKEKYGTVRFYAQFGYLSLHTLVYPGYAYNQFPTWLFSLDINYITTILSPLEKLFYKWQKKVYIRAYKEAVIRWPHLREEILSGADESEWLKEL